MLATSGQILGAAHSPSIGTLIMGSDNSSGLGKHRNRIEGFTLALVTADQGGTIQELVEATHRLSRHARAIRNGDISARGDLATTLHLLIGEGDGYGLLIRGLDSVGLDLPSVPGWHTEIKREFEGSPVRLGFRTATGDSMPEIAITEAMNEPCVFVDMPELDQTSEWSFATLTTKVRNNWGGHVERKPPRWLASLRYFPASGCDITTLLIWSAAETLLQALSRHLVDAGFDDQLYDFPHRQLAGVELQQAYACADASGRYGLIAQVQVPPHHQSRSIVFGGELDQCHYMFAISNRQMETIFRPSDIPFDDFAKLFQQFGPEGPQTKRNAPCWCNSGRKTKQCHADGWQGHGGRSQPLPGV